MVKSSDCLGSIQNLNRENNSQFLLYTDLDELVSVYIVLFIYLLTFSAKKLNESTININFFPGFILRLNKLITVIRKNGWWSIEETESPEERRNLGRRKSGNMSWGIWAWFLIAYRTFDIWYKVFPTGVHTLRT